MKFWIKIETLLNKILVMIGEIISTSIVKLTPSKIKSTLNEGQQKINETTGKIKEEVTTKTQKAISQTIQAKESTLKQINKTKEDTNSLVTSAKTYNWKSLTFTKIAALLGAFLAPPIKKVKLWWLNLKPTTILGFFVASAATTLTGITIYTQSKDIISKTSSDDRAPASIVDKMPAGKLTKTRSIEKRTLRLANVKMPVYIQSRKHLNTLLMDFTIISSNVYIREYFYDIENEALIRDRLSVKVQQFVSDFSLEEQGKDIIRKKIKEELNILLSDMKIKGEIEEVYIHHLLAN